MTKTRNNVSVWLLGMPDENITGSGLPNNGSIVRNFFFHNQEHEMTIEDSAKATIHSTMVIWNKAHIATQCTDSAVRKLRTLYNDYCDFKKNCLSLKAGYRVKEQMFKSDLDDLFDILTKDALATMSNDEGKQFLQMMRDDPSSASMAGIDKSLADKEARKNKRIARATFQMEKSNTLAQQAAAAVYIDDTSSESSNDSNDDDFHAPLIPHKPKRIKKEVLLQRRLLLLSTA